jgi:hypothetical protein
MKKGLPFLAIILGVVLVVIAVIIPSGSEKNNFVRMVKMLPQEVGEFSFFDAGMLQNDEDLLYTWNSIKDYFLEDDIYGENLGSMTGLGVAGSEYDLVLYSGDFDLEQMKTVIEQNSLESFEYEGITVWTDQYAYSTAVIDNVVFIGTSEKIQLCINASNGQGTSLYDNKDVRDIINRLPGGYLLGVVAMGDENATAEDYGLLAVGMAASKDNGNISQMSLLKFEDADALQEYLDLIESEITEDYDVTQDGQYLTISSTSEIPTLEEQAYAAVYNGLQNAVMAYAANNSGALPTINGTVNISGYDFQIIDICALLTSEGGILSEVPEGIAGVNGSDNDNCDAGCEGCLETNHYIWAIDDYGYIYSTCVGANCSEYNSDGYQDVWP